MPERCDGRQPNEAASQELLQKNITEPVVHANGAGTQRIFEQPLPYYPALKLPEMQVVFSSMEEKVEKKVSFFWDQEASIAYVPFYAKRAGRLLKNARERHGVTVVEIAKGGRSHFKGQTIAAFEEGKINLNLKKVLKGAQLYIEDDPDIAAIARIVEEHQWMRTLTREGMTLGRALSMLRLSVDASRAEFAKKAQINHSKYCDDEKRSIPGVTVLNQIIGASQLDTSRFPAQLLRLMRANILPMTLTELQTSTFSELFRYLRQIKGVPSGLRKNVIGATEIFNIENSVSKPQKKTVEKSIEFFALDPQSTLVEIIRIKAVNPMEQIPRETIEKIFTGDHGEQYFFAQHLEEIGEPSLSVEDKHVLVELRKRRRQTLSEGSNNIIGASIRYLRQGCSLSHAALAQDAKTGKTAISRIETGVIIPEDKTIMHILNAMGYDIHHPIASYFLDLYDLARS